MLSFWDNVFWTADRTLQCIVVGETITLEHAQQHASFLSRVFKAGSGFCGTNSTCDWGPTIDVGILGRVA